MEDARVLVYLHKNASWDGLSIQCASQSIKVSYVPYFINEWHMYTLHFYAVLRDTYIIKCIMYTNHN